MMKLKKSQIFTIVTGSVAAVLLTGVLVIGLSADGFSFGEEPSGPRSHEHREDIQLNEDEVLEEVEVNWVTGPVKLGKSPDGDIHVTESAYREIDVESAMSVACSGGKLTVRWDGKWFRKWINWGIFNFGRNDKALEILLPAGTGGPVNISVSNTSGGIEAEGFAGDEMDFSSVSGDLVLRNMSAADAFSVSTMSGDILLEGVSCSELEATTTSGEMNFGGMAAEKLELSTTSGECEYTGTAQEVKASTISGGLRVELAQRPVEVEMESVSGDLALGIPENEGFIADYSSISGDFDTEFGEKSSGRSGKLRYGAGGAEFSFDTTSGSMDIYKVKDSKIG